MIAIVALVFIVIGGVGLARAGVDFNAVPLSRTQVAGLWFTNMSALITLIGGVLMLVPAIDPDGAKASSWFFGVILLAFGLIVALSPQPFTNMWGYGVANGVFYIVAGVILLITAAVSPVIYSRHAVVSEHEVLGDDVMIDGDAVPRARSVTYDDRQRLRPPA